MQPSRRRGRARESRTGTSEQVAPPVGKLESAKERRPRLGHLPPDLMASDGYGPGGGEQNAASSGPPPLEHETGAQDQTHEHAALIHDIEVGEFTLQKLETEFNQRKFSIHALKSISTELDQRKAHLLSEIQLLRQGTKNEGPRYAVQRLMLVLEVLKDQEKWESDFQSSCGQKCTSMHVGILELEKGIYNDNGNGIDGSVLDRSIVDAQEKINLAKRELGAKLRAILSLKRQFDDIPVQTELIQYEQRFSELDVQIQERLRQTRKHFDTYNALLEIKELMLKEISLLNSISSQFQDAIVDTGGRSKLIDSMEAIVTGTKQKLKKVEVGLDSEQKFRDSLKEKYSTAIAAQRHFSSLLKAFQEECAKHEMLRSLTST